MPEGDESWCALHEIDHCSLCKPKPGLDKTRTPSFDRGDVTEAKFYGVCPACKNSVYPGDTIVSSDKGWVHEGCD